MRVQRVPVRGTVLLLVLVFAAGCGRRGLPAPDLVARIGGRDVTYSHFLAYLEENSLIAEDPLSSEVLTALFDQFIDEILLTRLLADRQSRPESTPLEELLDTTLEKSVRSSVTEADVEGYYERHRDEMTREETVLLEQILVDSREAAARTLAAIRAGASFADAAREYSHGPGAEFGGLQGELGRADLPPAFVDVIFNLEEGEVSEIVTAEYGYHLFRVVEKRPPADPTLEEVRADIIARLETDARARELARLVEDARRSYNVVVYVRNLPFNYAGSFG